MRLAKGPRPWTVHLFALILLAYGLWGLVENLISLDDIIEILQFDVPWVAWNADLAIVAVSATFTIVLIPLAAVWLFASKIARIIMTVFAALSLPQLVAIGYFAIQGQHLGAMIYADALATPAAVALLYTPSASRWLKTKGTRNAEAFE